MKNWPVLSEPTEPPELWWSVDPGDVHVGLAQWSHRGLVSVLECDPMSLLVMLERDLPDFVVCERWALYGWQAAQQSGSEFFTSQLIGGIKWVCWKLQIPLILQQASVGKAMYKSPRHNGRKWVGRNSHQRDAEAHGLAWLAKLDRIAQFGA